jgi:hypothetical protein
VADNPHVRASHEGLQVSERESWQSRDRLKVRASALDEEQLKGTPKYAGDSWDWEDRERGRKAYEYYGMPYLEY